MSMNVPTIEDMVMGIYREILAAKEKLKELEKDPGAKTYPIQIDIWRKMNELKDFILRREEFISMHKTMIRDEILKELGIDDEDI